MDEARGRGNSNDEREKIRLSRSPRGAAEHGDTAQWPPRIRKLRPCCGLRCDACTCMPPPGLDQRSLRALALRYLDMPLKTIADTTDVSKFQFHMRDRCQFLPIWVVLLYAYARVDFKQEDLFKAMIDKKALLFKQPWVDWARRRSVICEARRRN